MSLTTSKTVYRVGYQPLMPGVFVAPFPYHYRYGWLEKHSIHQLAIIVMDTSGTLLMV
jgi:4-aminobutyrate aminotransferase-like enzyme